METTTGQIWYYEKDGLLLGPLHGAEIITLIREGGITGDTLIWAEHMEARRPAREVKEFNQYFSDEAVGSLITDAAQVRPWPRFFAKMVDLFIVIIPIAVIVMALFPQTLETTGGRALMRLLIWPITGAVWLVIEPWLLSRYGRSPGRSIFGITVKKRDGSLPSYSEAMGRSLKVWIKGLGFNIFIVWWIVMLFAYRRLKLDGITSWDREGGFVVEHGEYNIMVLVILIVIYILINIVAYV